MSKLAMSIRISVKTESFQRPSPLKFKLIGVTRSCPSEHT